MQKVVSVKEYLRKRKKEVPHLVSEVICISCYHRWVAVRPENTLLKDLECPKCAKQGTVIETGQNLD